MTTDRKKGDKIRKGLKKGVKDAGIRCISFCRD